MHPVHSAFLKRKQAGATLDREQTKRGSNVLAAAAQKFYTLSADT